MRVRYALKNRVMHFLCRFAFDAKGQFSVVMALSTLVLLLGIGGAWDISRLVSAKQMAQSAADHLALSASIADDRENQQRYVDGQTYQYDEIGGFENEFTGSMQGVVDYNPTNNPAGSTFTRATVSGVYQTTVLGIMGVNSLPFSATSDVTYAVREDKSASVFFVTDNSITMEWEDQGGERKIDRLQGAMKQFMTILSRVENYQDKFRTAFYGYNSILDTNTMIDPKWGVLTDAEIDAMVLDWVTNSTPALTRANQFMTPEPALHIAKNGTPDPLRFVVFMSDGANDNITYTPVCEPGQTPEHWVYGEQWYGTTYTYFYKPWFWYFEPWKSFFTYYPGNCDLDVYSPHNITSLEQCTDMKNNDIKIFSVAYDIFQQNEELAKQFMKDCSSGEDNYYFEAINGDEVDAVYAEIAGQIVKEVIRVKH